MATQRSTRKPDNIENNHSVILVEEPAVPNDEINDGINETNRDEKEIEKGLKAIEVQNRVLIKILIKKDIDYNSL